VITLLALAVVQAAPVTGELRERGTRDPLPGFVGWDEGLVPTDRRGAFELDLPEGNWELRFVSEGYVPLRLRVDVPRAEALIIYLEPEPAPLEVVVESRVDSPHGSFQILDRERVEDTPGTHGDPFRLVQSLPGVAQTREFSPSAGALSIRGAAPGDSKFFLDGVEIPYLFHFQEYASVFHTRLLERLEVYPSTFGAAYGNAVGGIVEAVSRPPEAERVHGGVNWSLVNGGGWVAAPVGDAGAASGSARRSYADFLGRASDQYTVWPVFWDYLGRYDHQVRPGHRVSLTLFGAGDRYGRLARVVDELDPLELEADPEFTFDRAFHAMSVRAVDDLGWLVLKSSLALVHDRWEGQVGDDHQRRRERYAWLREDGLIGVGDGLDLAIGFEAKLTEVERQAVVSQAWAELGTEAPLLTRGVPVDETLRRLRGGAYLEPRLDWGDVRIQPGLRIQWDTTVGGFAADPRVTVRYKPLDLVQIRAAAGRYTQSPSLDALSPTSGDPELGWTHSDQASFGVDLALVGRIEVSADLWGKRLYDTLIELPGEPPRAEDGWAAGLELTTRYRLRERFFAGMVLTVGRSVRDGAPFEFDQPFAFGAVGSYSTESGWTFGARYRYSVGLPYTPVTDGLYDGDSDTYEPVFGAPNSVRMPPFQKLDLRVAKELELRRFVVSAYADLWIVPPANAALYPIYSHDYRQVEYVSGPSVIPLVGIQAEL
jgi:hypothetical protein